MKPVNKPLRMGAVLAVVALLALLGTAQPGLGQSDANLRPTSLRVLPFEVQEGVDREVTLISDVEHTGEATVEAVTVEFFQREIGAQAWTSVERVELSDLGPGSKVQAQSKLLVYDPNKPDAGGLTTGTYEIRALVDPDDAIAETDEADNEIATASRLQFAERRAPHLTVLHHRLRWRAQIPSERPIRGAVARDPGGTLYVASDDGCLYAISAPEPDSTDGSVKWAFPEEDQEPLAPIRNAPTVASDGTIYISTQQGRIYAVTPSGAAKWERPVEAETALTAVAVAPDQPIVYAGGEDGVLYRIWDHPAEDGSPSRGEITRRIEIGAPLRATPVVTADGTLYVGADNGRFYAFESGMQAKWDTPFVTGAFLRAPPVVQAERLYLGSGDGTLYALEDRGDRVHLRWSFPIGTSVRTAPIVDPQGDVYVGADDGTFYALRADGTVKWRYRGEGSIQASAALGPDETVLVVSTDGRLSALDRESGRLHYVVPFDAMVTGDLRVHQDTLYIATWGGLAGAIDLSPTGD